MKKTLLTCLLLAPTVSFSKDSSNLSEDKKTEQTELKKQANEKNLKTTSSSKTTVAGKLEIGQKIPDLPENSNLLAFVNNGDVWSQKNLENKLAIIFYVAPGEKDLNRHVTDTIKKANLNKQHYSSYAIVNMKASPWPNFILSWKLSASQKEFKNTNYVKDYKRVLVEKWGLKDNSNDVVLLKNGKVLFLHKGKLPKERAEKLVELLKQEIAIIAQSKEKNKKVVA